MLNPAEILVIFDLDFTLIDNSMAICKAFNHALATFQIKPLNPSVIIELIGIPLKEMFLKYVDESKAEKGVLRFREYYSLHYLEGTTLIPGALRLLSKLQEEGYQLALLTSKKTHLAVKLLEDLDLKRFFSYILGEQEEFKPKPEPDSVLFILSQFSNIQKAYMVGDHIVDCQAAHRAGISFVGVLTGNVSEAQLRKCAGIENIILKSVQYIVPSKHFS